MARIRGLGGVAGHVKRNGRPKVRYETREDAQAASAVGQKPYLCGLCAGWHVGARKGA